MRERAYLPVASCQVLYGSGSCLHSLRAAAVLLNDSQVDVDDLRLPEESYTVDRLTALGH